MLEKGKMRNKRKVFLESIVVISLGLLIWALWGNKALELNTYIIESGYLPKGFDGYRIVHVSDLHNTEMGADNTKLLTMIQSAEPDLIAITGDLIDSRSTDVEVALQFAKDAVKIAPVCYVTGNHEARVSVYSKLKEGLINLGVEVLEEECLEILQSGDTISILGVDDPSFQTTSLLGNTDILMESTLQKLVSDNENYKILLSHRPELYDTYVRYGIDLILCGHAHGGQFRVPWIGGLIAPDQGLFPKYDAGVFFTGRTNMVVSRGIGNSILPLRINNRPEVILLELKNSQEKK